MKIKLHQLFIVLAMFAGANHAAAQGTTAFTYQGQLRDGGTNAYGAYTMIFKLYDASTNGNPVGIAITNSPNLFNGLFSVNLDFGAGAFNGNARWLDITVTNGPTTQTLWPRVQVLPSPYALFAAVAGTVTNGAITGAQLATNSVGTTNIQSGAITSAQLAIGAVANSNLAVNAVATTNIQNGAVTTAKIANNAVTTAQIADSAVANRNLAANAVNATNIASGQVVKTINGIFTDNVVLSLIGILQQGANTALFPVGTNLQVSALVPNMQVFTTNGIFVVPSNVTRIKVELWGGGGGGGKSAMGAGAGGGGAGGYAFNIFSVIPGTNFTVTVGIGGTNGVAGTFSTFAGSAGALMGAAGGGAGTNATSSTTGGGGIGGATTNSIVPFAGSAGDGGSTLTGAGGNGASASGEFGGTGGWGDAGGAGRNATGPGAGGGGGATSSNSNGNPGGTGGSGLVVFYY